MAVVAGHIITRNAFRGNTGPHAGPRGLSFGTDGQMARRTEVGKKQKDEKKNWMSENGAEKKFTRWLFG